MNGPRKKADTPDKKPAQPPAQVEEQAKAPDTEEKQSDAAEKYASDLLQIPKSQEFSEEFSQYLTNLEHGKLPSEEDLTRLNELIDEQISSTKIDEEAYLKALEKDGKNLDRVLIAARREEHQIDTNKWTINTSEGLMAITYDLSRLEIYKDNPDFKFGFIIALYKCRQDETFRKSPAGQRTLEHLEYIKGILLAHEKVEATEKPKVDPKSTIFIGDSITEGMKDDLGVIEGNHMVKGATSAKGMAKKFPDFLEKNKDRIEKGELKQVIILAGYNDICNIEANTELSVEEKVNKIFESLKTIYDLALKHKPPLKVIACTLTKADFGKAVTSIQGWSKRKDKTYPGDADRMQTIYKGINEKIKSYPGITVIDLAEETKDASKYPLQENSAAHHTDEGSRNLAAYIHAKAAGTESVEIESNVPSQIQTHYNQELAKVDLEKRKEDISKLQGTAIKDLRGNPRLLQEAVEGEKEPEIAKGIKSETLRRLSAYTNRENEGSYTKGWYTLNYQKMGADPEGLSHEMNVGLGELLLDPDIKKIEVITRGERFIATRGVVQSGPHKGRQAFLHNGDYVATYTGDRFRILSNEITITDEKDPKYDKEKFNTYVQTISTETTQRKEDAKNFGERIAYEKAAIENPDGTFPYVKLDPSKSVVEQIKVDLSTEQLGHAKIIETEFKKAGMPPEIIAAAIVNAEKESGLSNIQSRVPDLSSKGHNGQEDSWGLFQINIPARTANIKPEEERLRAAAEMREDMKDPAKNCQMILKEIKSKWGDSLRAAVARKASVAELSALFCKYIERPLDVVGGMRARSQRTAEMFGISERPKTEQPTTVAGKNVDTQTALNNKAPLPPLQIKEGASLDGVTAETLRLAEQECVKGTRKPSDVLERENYLKVVDLAAKKIGIPAYAILAVHYRETRHKFSHSRYGDGGKANGMGQLWWQYKGNPKGSWDYAKENPDFRETMAVFTDQSYSTLEGSQSILADCLATAAFLKRSAKIFGIDINYHSNLTAEQLADLRWGYHVPGNARKGTKKGERNYGTKGGSYRKYAKLALEYKSALGNETVA